MNSQRRARTGGDCVVDVLEWAGVRTVFGIPSVHNLPIYDALARRGTIRAVTVRHEQTAAAAADGYARVTGGLGVFITSTGPGAANAMTGMLEALTSGSPVLHITGQIESQYLGRGRGYIHEVPDQPSMLAAASKAVLRADLTAAISPTIAEAANVAMRAPSGPVSVEIPIDLQYAEATGDAWVPPGKALDEPPAGLDVDASWDLAASAIAKSLRPLIWAGGGAIRAQAVREVAELARRIGAGVLTTPNARGILPEDDPQCVGNLSWDPGVRELVKAADLLVAVGTRYQGVNTESWKMELSPAIVQIDVDPTVPGRNYEATVAVKGDARAVLRHVLGRLEGERERHDPDGAWLERVATTTAAARSRLRATLGPQESLLDELAGVLNRDTVVVKDSTIPAYTWGNRLLPVQRPRTAMMANSIAIGLGLAHALGASAATDGDPVVCMVGDGGFMLTAAELATIAAEELPVVVLLFNDGGYGILRNIQDRQYGRRIGVDLPSPDFCGLARALGVEAERVATPGAFGKAAKTALAARKPYLVEVDLEAIGPMAVPFTGTSRPPKGAIAAG